MKFKYNSSKNLFHTLNIVHGIAAYRNSIKKNPNKKIKKYTTHILYSLFAVLVAFITSVILYSINENKLFLEIITTGEVIVLFASAFSFIILLCNYYSAKNKHNDGCFIIDKDGITDNTDGVSIKFEWKKIHFIAIKDNIVTIIADSPVFLYAELKDINKFIKEIEKYKDETLLIIQ